MKRMLVAATAIVLLCLHATPAFAGWAIAYSPSTGYVTAFSDTSATAGARKSAMADCVRHADDCEIIEDDWNGCFAFAKRGKTGNGWAVGRGVNVQLAISDALAQCKQRTSGTCKVEINYCDGSGGFRVKYESCRQFEVWQQAVTDHGPRSEVAYKLCIELNQDLFKQGTPSCICN